MLTLGKGCRGVPLYGARVIDPDSATPVYVQLADILRRGIQDGTYPPNRALPSIRSLQETYGVADGTIQKALKILREEGLVVAVRGRGTYVTPASDRGGSAGGRA